MDNICCKDCEHHEVFKYGMRIATTQYEGHICKIEPHVGEFDPVYGENKGYTILRKNHIERNAPKWYPKRNPIK